MEAFKKAKDEFKLQFLHKEEIHAAPVTGTAYALSDIRLLLVEDNKLTRKITTEILSEEGAVVVSVENGKAAKVPLEAYATKTNRRKLTGAYSDKSPVAGILWLDEDKEVLFKASSGRMLLVHTGAVSLKTTRSTQGIQVLKIKKGHRLTELSVYQEGFFTKPQRYRAKTLPAAGALPSNEDTKDEQLSLL